MVSVTESEWPDLKPDTIAHVFGEHEPIVLGSRTINWMPDHRDPRMWPGRAVQRWDQVLGHRHENFRVGRERVHPALLSPNPSNTGSLPDLLSR